MPPTTCEGEPPLQLVEAEARCQWCRAPSTRELFCAGCGSPKEDPAQCQGCNERSHDAICLNCWDLLRTWPSRPQNAPDTLVLEDRSGPWEFEDRILPAKILMLRLEIRQSEQDLAQNRQELPPPGALGNRSRP